MVKKNGLKDRITVSGTIWDTSEECEEAEHGQRNVGDGSEEDARSGQL